MDLETGQTIWNQNADWELPPASLTKVATALTLLECYSLDPLAAVEVPAGALLMQRGPRTEGSPPHLLVPDGTHIDLRIGERLTVESLLEGLLIRSGNDAANVLAWLAEKGSISTFVERMNHLVRSFGCAHTCFRNPHGLAVPAHYSSAADLARITRRALQHPLFRSIVSKGQFLRPSTHLQGERSEPTLFRMKRAGAHFDPRVRGGKTGTHSQAGTCLIAWADLNGREVIAVILGAVGTNRYRDAKLLLDWVEKEERRAHRLAKAGPIGTPRAIAGSDHLLQPSLPRDLVHQIFPSVARPVRLELRLEKGLKPPIEQDAEIGVLIALDPDGVEYARSPVMAASEVPPHWRYRLSQLWKHWGKWGDGAVLLSLLLALLVWVWALTVRIEKHSG